MNAAQVNGKSKQGSGITRRLLASILVIAVCAAVVPLAAGVSRAAAAPDLRTFLASPTAEQGDGTHHLGFHLAPPAAYATAPAPGGSNTFGLGASVDLSGQLPPIGNQGSQGSCVAWATSYYYKTWSEKQEHAAWSLTSTQDQFSPSFVYNQINGGADNGSSFTGAFNLLQTKGDVDIAEFPYNQGNWTNQPSAAQLEAAKA